MQTLAKYDNYGWTHIYSPFTELKCRLEGRGRGLEGKEEGEENGEEEGEKEAAETPRLQCSQAQVRERCGWATRAEASPED